MKKQLNRICCKEWGRVTIATVITSVFFAAIYRKSCVAFFINDDENIMYTLAGYYTNGVMGDHPFVNYLLGLIIRTMYSLIPSVPWYGVFHVMVLFSSIVIIGKCLLKEGCLQDVQPILPIYIFSAITLLCFIYPVTLMQFTVTSAISGVAAIALLLTLEDEKSSCILSVVFMLLCYLHRKNTGNVVLCFYALVAIYRCAKLIKQSKRIRVRLSDVANCKPIITLAVALVCILCAVFISEGVVRTTEEWDAYYEYDEARFKVTDYAHDSYGTNPEMYEEMGWSASLYRLCCSGYLFFMDERVNADSFNTISSTGYQNTRSSMADCIANFTSLIHEENMAMVCLCLIGALLILVFVFAARNLKKNYLEILLVVCTVGGAGIMVAYLCWKGRFILRAFQTIAYPTIVILAVSLLRVMGNVRTGKKKISVNVVTALLVLGSLTIVNIGYHLMTETRLLAQSRIEKSERTHLVEEYAIDHSDNMYIYDTSLTFRYSPFITYVDEYPSNLSYWGGMGWNSPTLLDQAEQNGIDRMYSDIFFRDNVYYISYSGYTTAQGETIVDLFMDYMTETYGSVIIELVDSITPEIGVYKVLR